MLGVQTMKIMSLNSIGSFVFLFCLSSMIAQENNYFSPYLIETYNLNMGKSKIRVVNPIGRDLSIYFALFDDEENAQKCFISKLAQNNLIEFSVDSILPARSKPEYSRLGDVKIISFIGDSLRPETVVPGIIGFQQNTGFLSYQRHASESNLAAIPKDMLFNDLSIILKKYSNLE